MIQLTINQKQYSVDVPPEMPLLWVIRDVIGRLSADNSHPVQKAWIMEDAPQCGYCQSGQIMAAAALLKEIPEPSDIDIDDAMMGNICRCGTYPRIRKAIHTAAKLQKEGGVK